jgi:H+-transporting ATPase
VRWGLRGAVCPIGPVKDDVRPQDFAVFAGVLPGGKYRLVQAFQEGGHAVGMCGDGANDAPALRQAQMGIAVSTATDIAKSAAGIVLTAPSSLVVVAAELNHSDRNPVEATRPARSSTARSRCHRRGRRV